MPLFISFPVSPNTKVNIAEEITDYTSFGTLLLDDDGGNKVSAIVQEHHSNAKKINWEIFRRWLEGERRQPLSWPTLVQVLKDIGLKKLAKDIEQAVF